MVDSKIGYRKLVDLRNQFYLNQVDLMEFLKRLEIICYNYISKNGCEMAGGKAPYCYTTIARRLMKEPLGETDNLENLKIDLLLLW